MQLLLGTLQKRCFFCLPGRDHESCQKCLSHPHGKLKRIFPYYYEVDKRQDYTGMDCKSAKQNQLVKQIDPSHCLSLLRW